MNGKYYEDLEVGDTITTAGRTVTETDLMTFIGMAGIYEEFYINADYALNESVFKARFVPGLLSLSLSEGLTLQTGMFDGTGLVLLEVTTRFKNPVIVGETIYVDVEVLSMRTTKKPDRGIVKLRHGVWKRDESGERVSVIDVEKTRMVRRRPQDERVS